MPAPNPRAAVSEMDEAATSHDIALQARADIKKRDWGRVHIEADRRPAITLRLQRWFYS